MIRRRWTDLVVAVGFFTRLPVYRLLPGEAEVSLRRAVWAFPLGGLVAALGPAAIFAAASLLGLPPLPAAAWSLAGGLLLTGALHEDGLADLADAAGARDLARRLAVMRDSRIGSFGALALIVSSLVRVSALAACATPGRVALALLLAGTLSRGGILVLLLALPPARSDGLAASLLPLPRAPAAWGLSLALLPALPLAPLLGPLATVRALAAALLALLLCALACRRLIGGHTGDALGAVSVAIECVVLSACVPSG